MFFPERELLRLLPRVLRAREFRLYLEGGKKLTDLWLAGGRAALGHKAPRLLGELKNAGERGLFTPLPHPAERRFFKALSAVFPGRAFRLYSGESSLYRVLEKEGFIDPDIPVYDPAFPPGGRAKGRVSLWRPFLGAEENPADGESGETAFLLPVLPWPLGPAALVLDKTADASFPPGELVPPVLLAPAARALYDLAALEKAAAGNRGKSRYPKIENALKNGPWRRRGIYLTREPGLKGEAYKALFLDFLEGGFLIPPSQKEPLVLAAPLSPGEESKLAELLKL